MITKKKSDAMRYMEKVIGGPLTFGVMLQAIRQCDELTLADFGAKLGISRAHVCEIEKGRKSVSPERAAAWAKILGYPEQQFVRLALNDMLHKGGLRYDVSLQRVA